MLYGKMTRKRVFFEERVNDGYHSQDSTNPNPTMSTDENIKSLLSEAAKYYAVKDFEKSTNLYSELNELNDALTGQNNADYLYLYGKSLFQLALSHSEVLGGGPDDEDPINEDQDESSEQKQQMYQFNEVLAEGDEIVEEERENTESEEAHGQEKVGTEGEEDGDNEEDEKSDDFESAWEILDLARAIYEKQGDKPEIMKKLSETYDILGEISLEAENFSQAKEDFQHCLQIRQKLYSSEDPTNRLIIESFYKLSLALEFDPLESESCKENLNKAVQLLKRRIDEKHAEEGDKDLLKELKLKLRELQAVKNPLEVLKSEGMLQIQRALSGDSSVPAPVNDLTSMVKKRKSSSKPDVENEKKPRKQ